MKLYDYQLDMMRRIDEAFESHQSVMVQMPTGTGKSVLLAEQVKSEERRVKNPCVWIVVHRRELVEQIKETLAKQLDSSLFTLRSSLKQSDSSLFTLPLSGFSPFSGYLVIIMSWMSARR